MINLSIRWFLLISFILVFVPACFPEPLTAAPGGTIPASSVITPTMAAGVPSSMPFATATIAKPTSTPAPSAEAALESVLVWKTFTIGLQKPVDLAEIPDDRGRLLVVEQSGTIRVVTRDGILQPETYLDLRDRVSTDANERGLLGIALHPRFNENRYFFLNYTDLGGNTVISRFTSDLDASRADPKTEKVLLQVKQPYSNHNGGGLAFGPDGYLYIALGDGGSAGDPQNRAQSLDSLLGKLLRIDVDKGNPYSFPSTNPYVKGGGKAEIWAFGLRNPWRFSFDRQTGDLYIGDVGQSQWEEINWASSGSLGGLNYGWRYKEGLHAYAGQLPVGAVFEDPIWEYSHSQGCSITGGYVYRGQKITKLQGAYIYGDYCSGMVWGLRKDPQGIWQNVALGQVNSAISSFGQGLDGELYLLDHRGSILKLEMY